MTKTSSLTDKAVIKPVFCAVFAALICAVAPISVPIGPVPVSLATFAVMLAGFVLGPASGPAAVLIYLLLGTAGVPVFAGWKSGPGVIAGPTGGYLAGYALLALACGLYMLLPPKLTAGVRKYVWMSAFAAIGTALLYAFGTLHFCLQTGTNASAAIGICVLPFIPGDVLKTVAAVFFTAAIQKSTGKLTAFRKEAKK